MWNKVIDECPRLVSPPTRCHLITGKQPVINSPTVRSGRIGKIKEDALNGVFHNPSSYPANKKCNGSWSISENGSSALLKEH